MLVVGSQEQVWAVEPSGGCLVSTQRLSPDSLLCRVDQDSALHNDLQILKEKEGADFILLNFSFKVRWPVLSALSLTFPVCLQSCEDAGLPSLTVTCLSLRITSPLTHRSSGLCLQSSLEGEWLGKGNRPIWCSRCGRDWTSGQAQLTNPSSAGMFWVEVPSAWNFLPSR